MIYKFTLAPAGAIGTPFRSDTLFGHACWAILQSENEVRAKEFISAAAGQEPEIVFSDGFPAGWLPRPLLPKLPRHYENAGEYSSLKKAVKDQWVNKAIAEQNRWDPSALDRAASAAVEGYSDAPTEQVMLRNVIDRMTGTSLDENGLYSQNQYWYSGIWEKIDIYISTMWEPSRISAFLATMFAVGYGRDQTVGLGKVTITGQPVAASFTDNRSDLYMSLSRMVPGVNISLKESFYKIETKYGKVWSALEQKNPFKKRILQTVPGSVFKINGEAERAGRVLSNVHDNCKVIENCMAVLYPLPLSALQGVTL